MSRVRTTDAIRSGTRCLEADSRRHRQVKWETDRSVSEQRRRWNRSVKAKRRGDEESSTDGSRMQRDDVIIGISQKMSAVVIEDSVAALFAVNVGAPVAEARSVQIIGDVGSQRSTGGGQVRQEEEGRKDVEVEPVPVEQDYATLADTGCVSAPEQVGGDVLVKVKKILEKLQEKNASLYGVLVAKKTAHARASMDNIRLQREKKKAVTVREEAAWLLTEEKSKRENSAVVEQLKNDVSAVTLKAGERIGSLAASLEQAEKGVEKLKKGRETVIRVVGKLCRKKACVEDERDGLQAKLQRAERKRDRYINAVNRVKSGVGNLQKIVVKDTSTLQQLMEGHCVRMCQHLEALLAERVLETREDQTRDAGGAASLYVESSKNCLKRIKQLVCDSSRTGNVQAEKPVTGSAVVDESNNAPISPVDVGNDVGAISSSA